MIIIGALHYLQAALSSYGLYVSYISITNLLQYEDTTKRAAKYSGTAEQQLYKTRTTQASAAISILASLLTSLALATAAPRLNVVVRYGAAPALLAVTLAARAHVSNFWKASAKVPFMSGYNEAIRMTEEALRVLGWLAGSWAGVAVVGAVLGYA